MVAFPNLHPKCWSFLVGKPIGQLGKPTHFTGNPPAIVANPKVGSVVTSITGSEAGFLHFGIDATCIYSLCLPTQVGPQGDTWEDTVPQTDSPPRIRCSGMNRNIKLLVKLHILDWYSSEGGFFVGGIFLVQVMFGGFNEERVERVGWKRMKKVGFPSGR